MIFPHIHLYKHISPYFTEIIYPRIYCNPYLKMIPDILDPSGSNFSPLLPRFFKRRPSQPWHGRIDLRSTPTCSSPATWYGSPMAQWPCSISNGYIRLYFTITIINATHKPTHIHKIFRCLFMIEFPTLDKVTSGSVLLNTSAWCTKRPSPCWWSNFVAKFTVTVSMMVRNKVNNGCIKVRFDWFILSIIFRHWSKGYKCSLMLCKSCAVYLPEGIRCICQALAQNIPQPNRYASNYVIVYAIWSMCQNLRLTKSQTITFSDLCVKNVWSYMKIFDSAPIWLRLCRPVCGSILNFQRISSS